MKISATSHAQRREGDLDAERLEVLPEPAVLGVERCQGDAGNRGRQGKRQIDESIDDALCPESGSAPKTTPAESRTRC